MIDVGEIEKRIDRAVTAPIPIQSMGGGITPENMGQATELAKLMSVSGAAVPKYLRGNPGACLAILSRALRWQMDPYAVAEKSYIAYTQGGDERIGYESQLVHAIVIRWAPLKGRLRTEILGDGDERRCKVTGLFIGESKPHEYISETLGKLRDARGRNDKGRVKGSPLWDDQPEVQLFYSAVRQWARMHCPEVLLGVYTPEEITTSEDMIEVNERVSALSQRLRDSAKDQSRGFDVAHVNRVIESEADDGSQDDGPESAGDNLVDGNNDRRESRARLGREANDQGRRTTTDSSRQATGAKSAKDGEPQKGAQAASESGRSGAGGSKAGSKASGSKAAPAKGQRRQ